MGDKVKTKSSDYTGMGIGFLDEHPTDRIQPKTLVNSPEVRERVYNSIAPSSYPGQQSPAAYARVLTGKKRMGSLEEITNLKIQRDKASPVEASKIDSRLRKISEGYGTHDEDMWRFYLGIPQLSKSVVKSSYAPTVSKDPNSVYYTLDENTTAGGKKWKDSALDYIQNQERLAKAEKRDLTYPRSDVIGMSGLANVTIGKGKDEKGDYYSIYDVYDFHKVPFAKKIGKPYEIYDRIYLPSQQENLQNFGREPIVFK